MGTTMSMGWCFTSMQEVCKKCYTTVPAGKDEEEEGCNKSVQPLMHMNIHIPMPMPTVCLYLEYILEILHTVFEK